MPNCLFGHTSEPIYSLFSFNAELECCTSNIYTTKIPYQGSFDSNWGMMEIFLKEISELYSLTHNNNICKENGHNTFESKNCLAKILCMTRNVLGFYFESLAFQRKISLMIHLLNPALEARHSKVSSISKFNYVNLRFLYVAFITTVWLFITDD